MVKFNELRISKDEKYLIIDVQILNDPIYKNTYIDAIYVDTQKTFVNTGPSNKCLTCCVFENNEKHVIKYIDIDSISDNLFFIWVTTKGEVLEDAPCTTKRKLNLGVTYNMYLMYNNIMKYVNTLDTCNPNKDFIDFILQKEAFELALKTEHYCKAIEFWNKFYKNQYNKDIKSCSCGKY